MPISTALHSIWYHNSKCLCCQLFARIESQNIISINFAHTDVVSASNKLSVSNCLKVKVLKISFRVFTVHYYPRQCTKNKTSANHHSFDVFQQLLSSTDQLLLCVLWNCQSRRFSSRIFILWFLVQSIILTVLQK